MKTREWDRQVAPRLLEALPEGWTAHNGHLSTVDADGHLAWHISKQITTGGVDEIVPLCERFALPHFHRHGRDLTSFLTLNTQFARSRPSGRGTWTTEAWSAGAHSLLGNWAEARRSWVNCLTELAYFDTDVAPDTRRLAAHGVDAEDVERRRALVAWLLENEHDMRLRWHLP